METNNPNNRRIEDEFPESDISSIQPISKRLHTIYARIKDKHYVVPIPTNIFAVIFMVEGLEYHYENFKRLVEGVSFPPPVFRNETETILIQKAKFEAVAYINTVGQLYYWVTDCRGTHAPKIKEITESFRHKYTAHLSIHKKDKRDSEIARALHLFAFIGGTLWGGNGNLIFQIQKQEGEVTNFNLIREHEVILEEIQNTFQVFVNERADMQSMG